MGENAAMDSFLAKFLFHQWERKLLSILIAITAWFFVDHSIIATKAIQGIPIRIVNLPKDKTITAILPNGYLHKRVTLNITGTKDVIDRIEPGDLEVVLDASNQPNEWLIQISKKNLVSLNPEIDLANHVSNVDPYDFTITLSPFITDKIPIFIPAPIGNPPDGYEFLDIWPNKFFHTLSGPQEPILNLKTKGIKQFFDLSKITKEQLDSLKTPNQGLHDDEIAFPVPEEWKQITFYFLNNLKETINDPEAKNIFIYFLRKELHPIDTQISVRAFYPLKTIEKLNPQSYSIAINEFIKNIHGVFYLNRQLYTTNVSKLFLDIVKENIEIDIVAAPVSERENLEWSVDFIDPLHLEDTYVAYQINTHPNHKNENQKEKESLYRQRFRSYMKKFTLYISKNTKLELSNYLHDNKIIVEEKFNEVPSAF